MELPRVKEILDQIYAGLSLKDALGQKEREPFYKFLDSHPEYAKAYDRAQQVRAELVVDEIIEIADGLGDPHRARNQIDARKWYASKMRPSKYGDRIDVNVTTTVDLTAALMAADLRLTQVKDVECQVLEKKEATTPISDGPISRNIPTSIGS